MNGRDDDSIKFGRDKIERTFQRFDSLYGFETSIMPCSDFMGSEDYRVTFQRVQERVKDAGVMDQLLKTVPESKKHLVSAKEYPLHELACVQFLSEQDFSLKIGPTKETQYDRVMTNLGFDVSFAYILDAYALGTRTADVVVHYVPGSRGPNNGQRIFLEDSARKVKIKLQQGCDEALRYFCHIASVSGHLLGLDYREEVEIDSLHGKGLKREAIRLVLDNIVKPYQKVISGGLIK